MAFAESFRSSRIWRFKYSGVRDFEYHSRAVRMKSSYSFTIRELVLILRQAADTVSVLPA